MCVLAHMYVRTCLFCLDPQVSLQLKAIAVLLRYCPPGCTQYYMAIASFHQLVVQHRWEFLEMTEMLDRMSLDGHKPVSRDLQCAEIHARMRMSVALAERGEVSPVAQWCRAIA